LPRSVLSPPSHLLYAPNSCGELGLLAGSSRRETRWRSGLRSSSRNLWGNCVGARVETSRGPDSARARFLIAPSGSVPSSYLTDRIRLRPEELVRYACQPAFAVVRGWRHQLSPTFPRSPGLIPVVLSLSISAHRAATGTIKLSCPCLSSSVIQTINYTKVHQPQLDCLQQTKMNVII
jgi:hypothetical protein